MGICIEATNSSIELNLSYGAFHNLRRNIAEVLDPELGELYHQLASLFSADALTAEKRIFEIVNDEDRFPSETTQGIIDFLFASDVGDSISYKACKQVYDLIKDVDFGNKCFQYVSYQNPQVSDYELFKQLLKECYSKHRKMRWQ